MGRAGLSHYCFQGPRLCLVYQEQRKTPARQSEGIECSQDPRTTLILLPPRVTTSNRVACKVLYDSRLLFRHRLYADLETILYHVHLFRPVSMLLRYPALYVRGAVPRMAFQALSR